MSPATLLTPLPVPNSRSYLGRFAQADTIIPELTQGVQAWDGYAYVNNNPVLYDDPSGHFTCKNTSEGFTGDCQKTIEAFLKILQEKGGEEGKKLVSAFRNADEGIYCSHSSVPCTRVEDQISITIVDTIKDVSGKDTDTVAQYGTNGVNTFTITAELMQMPDAASDSDLAVVGAFGHEIDHMANGPYSGTLLGEIHAYNTQDKLYNNMGINDSNNSYVNIAKEFGALLGASKGDVYASRLDEQYPGMPYGLLGKLFTK